MSNHCPIQKLDAWLYLRIQDFMHEHFRFPQTDNIQMRAFLSDKYTDTHCYVYTDTINGDPSDYERKPAGSHINLVFAFPGTGSLHDTLSGVCFIKKVTPYNNTSSAIRVHSGFLNAYKSIRDQVFKEVVHYSRIVSPDDWQIVCTGHGIGGALAQLCAVDIQYNFQNPTRTIGGIDAAPAVVTYGSPRVGNTEFAASFEQRIPFHWRFVNAMDIMPEIPMWGYRHCHRGINILGGIGHSAEAYLNSLQEWIGR